MNLFRRLRQWPRTPWRLTISRFAADRSGSPLGELAPEASEGGVMGNGGRPPGGNLETGNFYGRIQRVIDSSNQLALSPLSLCSRGRAS